MPRYDDRYGSTRLYVGQLSSKTRFRDLEHMFSKYGRTSVMHEMLMMQDTIWMEKMLMDVIYLWNLPKEYHAVLVELVSMLAEVVLLLAQAAASIVALMDIGLVIASLETGKTSAMAVEKEATLKKNVKMPRSQRIHDHL